MTLFMKEFDATYQLYIILNGFV